MEVRVDRKEEGDHTAIIEEKAEKTDLKKE